MLLGERGILLDIVKADAQNLDIVLLEISNLITKPAALGGTARSVRFRVEPQQHLAAAQFCERNLLARVSHQCKVRRWFANLRHH